MLAALTGLLLLLMLQLRVESVCQQLQRDIERMKSQKAHFQRHFEVKEKEFREWRLRHEREVQQLHRRAARQNAVLQQHVNMHAKQQVRSGGTQLHAL
jgi:hypothetical protein